MSEVEPGVLYVVATPLGNLGDISKRQAEILGDVDLIAAEDTRVTRKLTSHLDLRVRLVSCHDHNERERAPDLVRQLLEGRSIALVSDAGTPMVSDPGYHVVAAAVQAGIRVVPIPGPAAVTAALSASGLPTDRFLFLGFLPPKAGKRLQALQQVASQPATLVLYATPKRLQAVLRDLEAVLGDRRVALARDLTKRGEALFYGRLASLELPEELWGEWTLVVEGAPPQEPGDASPEVEKLIQELVTTELSARDIRDMISRVYGVPKGEIYQRVLELRQG